MQTIVKLLLFCRSKEQLNTKQGKTWSSGTNLRLPFAVCRKHGSNLSIIVATYRGKVGYKQSVFVSRRRRKIKKHLLLQGTNKIKTKHKKKRKKLQYHQNILKTHWNTRKTDTIKYESINKAGKNIDESKKLAYLCHAWKQCFTVFRSNSREVYW